jgi:hypothetical protein
MTMPSHPKLYHIVHVDRLASIVADESLLCDAEIARRTDAGTIIGMGAIKHRRLNELTLNSYPDLYVGQCVPFYFCPRSVMLYVISRRNHPELAYHGGQSPIVHLETDLHSVVEWAQRTERRWAFTLSNAATRYFEDRANLDQLDEIDWNAVQASDWRQCKEGKQAEFLVERDVSWTLIERVGVLSQDILSRVRDAISDASHRPVVEVRSEWYY